MVAKVAALYVRARSIYQRMPGIDCWDATRDAAKYNGALPIIAHPPCGHWGKFKTVCLQPGKDLGPLAIHQVRRHGGVLEHPWGSTLFWEMGIPVDGRDLWGGQLLLIDQGRFGHPCKKMTWLYCVGCWPDRLPDPGGPYRDFSSLSACQRESTPPRFAEFLYRLALGSKGAN
jgi:hypothetical protein